MTITILGSNRGATASGKRLRDGGACLIDSEGLRAIAEERLTRIKHDGGAAKALDFVLGSAQKIRADIWVQTSCCEGLPVPSESSNFNVARSVTVGHHLAHAFSAFYPSPFASALVIVLDCGGTTLDGTHTDWWKNSREQATYYLGQGSSLEVLEQDFIEPYSLGFGELFRAATHALGWPTATKAGNTMALAGLAERFSGDLVYHVKQGRLATRTSVNPSEPIAVAHDVAQSVGLSLTPRHLGGEITQQHVRFAALIQESFYQALKWRVSQLTAQTGVRNACFSGGVALNCVALGRLLDESVLDEIFVQPAAGDTGQCLGAALAGAHRLGLSRFEIPGMKGFRPYLGGSYSDHQVRDAVTRARNDGANLWEESSDPVHRAAELVARGGILGLFTDRSEFGPRSLGARSIVADPRSIDTRRKLTKLKGRDSFMPFAPSILEERVRDFFFSPGSDSMTIAVRALPQTAAAIPGVIHHDGTARVQTVGRRPALLRALIEEFDLITGIPVLTNTSFNRAGEPIVESPTDAIRVLAESSLDGVLFDDRLILKANVSL